MLAHDDHCWLCGHPDAQTADHVIPVKEWYERHGTYEGVNHPTNLRPAHGVLGRHLNRCPTCGQLCNQARRAHHTEPHPRSRNW